MRLCDGSATAAPVNSGSDGSPGASVAGAVSEKSSIGAMSSSSGVEAAGSPSSPAGDGVIDGPSSLMGACRRMPCSASGSAAGVIGRLGVGALGNAAMSGSDGPESAAAGAGSGVGVVSVGVDSVGNVGSVGNCGSENASSADFESFMLPEPAGRHLPASAAGVLEAMRCGASVGAGAAALVDGAGSVSVGAES